jgi:hypothetical protein
LGKLYYDRPNRLEILEVEPEKEADTDQKGPYILQSEVEKAIKEMNKKATGDDHVPGDVLKLLREGGLKTIQEFSEHQPHLQEIPQHSATLEGYYSHNSVSIGNKI